MACDPAKASAKIAYLFGLINRADVIFVQETHGCEDTQGFLEARIGSSFRCYWSHRTAQAGGLLAVLRLDFAAQFATHAWAVVQPFALTSISFSGPRGCLTLYGLYLDAARDRSRRHTLGLLARDCPARSD